MNRIFQQSYHIPGTLAANLNIKFKLPCDATLLHVSAVSSNDSNATLTVGSSSDADAYLTATPLGESGSPAEADGDDFCDADGNTYACYYPHIARGTIVYVGLDYDGDSGTAAQNVTIVLTFSEG